MKYSIVFFPTKAIQDRANSYRKRYDSHYAFIPPHITLKSAFEADEEEIKSLSAELKQIARSFEPLSITISKVSSFQPVNNVVYFKIELTEQIKALHEEIYRHFSSDPEYAYVPHITIARDLSNDEQSDVFGSLKMLDVTHHEVIGQFHLLQQQENGVWTDYETFHLGKGQKES
ncbi:2'-5' RNA ligase family protein [Bacillaceae bacterium Marseille-Q3522]|nr:2'-5' RNA ligase family protein [Bacillaceae bacterium Marseille-Q3522]